MNIQKPGRCRLRGNLQPSIREAVVEQAGHELDSNFRPAVKQVNGMYSPNHKQAKALSSQFLRQQHFASAESLTPWNEHPEKGITCVSKAPVKQDGEDGIFHAWHFSCFSSVCVTETRQEPP